MPAWALCSLLLLQAPPPSSEGAPLQAAMHLLQDEENTPANLEAAQKAFEAALATPLSPRQQALAHAHRALAYLRMGELEKNAEKKAKLFDAGIKESQDAVTADDSSADAWFYRGALVGSWAEQKGMVKALTHLGDIRTAFQKALKRDPHHAGAALALAIIEQRVPMLMGGSKSSAEKRFRGVLAEYPHHTRAMLDLAEFLVEDDRKDEAIALARKARDETAPYEPGEWRKFDQERAKDLLKQLKAN